MGRPKKIVKVDDVKTYKCLCCGAETDSPAGKFYKVNWSKLWTSNDQYMPVCKVCLTKKYNEDMRRYGARTAMMIACHYLDIPFVGVVFESVNSKNENFTIGAYSRVIAGGSQYANKTFAHSIVNGDLQSDIQTVNKNREVKWSEQDKKNMRFVISQYGYDPFCDESYDDADRKFLFNVLSGYVDDDEDDAHKRNSAVSLVKTMLQKNKIDALINNELLSSTPSADLKTYAETKDKFDRSINTIANDNGFSAKAQGKSAQKHNSLTRIMKEMIDSNFEECKVNAIDSKMKGVYKQMAEISNKNLFDQLNFQSDDYARMVAEQRSLLQKNDEKILKLEEENRKLRIMVRQLGGEKFLGHVSPSDSDQTQTGGDR